MSPEEIRLFLALFGLVVKVLVASAGVIMAIRGQRLIGACMFFVGTVALVFIILVLLGMPASLVSFVLFFILYAAIVMLVFHYAFR